MTEVQHLEPGQPDGLPRAPGQGLQVVAAEVEDLQSWPARQGVETEVRQWELYRSTSEMICSDLSVLM